jgi:4-amino-4-deoxychorismate lyase
MLAEQPVLAGVKHLNRLEQVLARAEWGDPGQAEGLMCSLGGNVIGGTMSNLFILAPTGLVTPRLDRCGIAGTIRRLVLENAARFGLTAVEGDLRVADVLRARGLFVTNALIGAWAVRQLGERRLDPRSLPLELLRWVRSAAQRPDPGSGGECVLC